MKRFLIWLMILTMGLTACAETQIPPAETVLECFMGNDYEALYGMLSEEMKAAVSAEALEGAWKGQLAIMGKVTQAEFVEAQGYSVALLTHEKGMQQMVVGLNDAGEIATLLLQPVAQPAAESEAPALPEGVQVRETQLFAGTEMELAAEIVIPAVENPVYAVLVHGSGPSDMNETIGGCSPFRDLAYDLAQHGVGSIRFDKMSYAHPEQAATVADEYLLSAREALRVVKEETGAERVIIIGHSQGGMLMPWLTVECGFDGGVALAGTPRQLWEISYQQNLLLLDTLTGEQREAAQAQVDAELQRAEMLETLGDGEVVFGMPVSYLKELAALDEIALAKNADVPMLFLWGKADFQVLQADFDAWKDGLGDDDRFSFISYPGLNHLFMEAQEGDNIANAQTVYARGGKVDSRVAEDIAAWLMK